MKTNAALLVVDVQNDFMPGGALAVPAGDSIVPAVNRYIELFTDAGLPVLASRDWHPPATQHFRAYGGDWPVHCVSDTPGAEFHPDLCLPQECMILSKGIDPARDGYSAFEGVTESGTQLQTILAERGITSLYICGLATDYCVKNTGLEGLAAGYDIYILADAVKGVDIEPGDSEKALQQLAEAGAELITIDRLE